jgi:GNAT superfamily N-acetyltransferase|tara:strand:+ start:255 stop:695 length:441 start_codon:yes stop_codon:yes gene_type:complete
MIRAFKSSDKDILLGMAKRMHQESEWSVLPFSDEQAGNIAHKVMGGDYACFVAEDIQVVGMIVGFVAPHYFTQATIAADLLCYVTPEKRGGTYGFRLIKAFEQWAYEQGASMVTLGITTGINTERTARLYEKLGYKQSGLILRKEL